MDESEDRIEADDTLKEWVRLRLIYNAILVPWTLGLGLLDPIGFYGSFDIFVNVPILGVLANVCFCTGAVIEYQLGRLGLPNKPIRMVLFVLGTLFTMFLAAGFVFVSLFKLPDQA